MCLRGISLLLRVITGIVLAHVNGCYRRECCPVMSPFLQCLASCCYAKEAMSKCFHPCWLVGWFVCLLTRLPQKIADECSCVKFLGQGRLNRLWGDVISDLDPGILFLLCLFAVYKLALLYYCSLDVRTLICAPVVRPKRCPTSSNPALLRS